MKLTAEHKQSLLDFIGENWEQFVTHVENREMVTRELAEELADEIHDILTEEVQYG